MEIVDAIKRALQDLIVPELEVIKADNRELKSTLVLTNKRLDDRTAHLVDQSRRIDEIAKKLDEINKRCDGTNDRIDHLRVELRDELAKTNQRIDRLYEVIVRRDEHHQLALRVQKLEQDVAEMRSKLAA
jgi:hypothetical protein